MKQASLKLYRNLQNASVLNNNLNIPKVVLRALLTTLALLGLIYALLLGLMVFNIVERKNLEQEMQTLSVEVSNLELEYLALAGSLDLELSRSLGFQERPANFATRKSLGRLGLNGNEI